MTSRRRAAARPSRPAAAPGPEGPGPSFPRGAVAAAAVVGLLLLLWLLPGADPPPSPVPPPPPPAPPVRPAPRAPDPPRPDPLRPRPATPPAEETEVPAAPAEEPPRKAGPVTFRVVAAETGEPFPGARLLPDARALPAGAPPAPGDCGPDGAFRLEGLLVGGQEVFVGAPGRETRRVSFIATEIAEGVSDIALRRTGAVRSVVRGPDGAPLAGVRVVFRTEPFGGSDLAEAETDEGGRLHVEGLPEGPVCARVGTEPGYSRMVLVPAGGVAEEALGGAPSVAGTSVTADGRPMGVVAVPLDRIPDPLAALGELLDVKVPGCIAVDAAEDGSFALLALEPGEWLLVTPVAEALVRVEAGAAGPVRVSLAPRFVSGRAVLPPDTEVPEVRILAIPAGLLDAALVRGERAALFALLAAEWRRDLDDIAVDGLGRFRAAVPGVGPHDLFAQSDGAATEAPVRAVASAEPGPAGPDLVFRAAPLVNVWFEGLERTAGALVVARNEGGVPVALGASDGTVHLRLVPGRYHLEIRGPGGARRDRGILVAPGEDHQEVEVSFE